MLAHVFPGKNEQLLPGRRAGAVFDAAVGPEVESADLCAERRDEVLGGRPRAGLAAFVHGQPQVFHAVPEFLGSQTAGRTARPAVFVIEPGLQTERLSGVRAGIDAVEPLASEVTRLQSGARVHEIPAHAHFLEDADLPDQFGGFELAVPTPERLAAVGGGGILPLRPRERERADGDGRCGHDDCFYHAAAIAAGRFPPFLSTIPPVREKRAGSC